MTVTLIALWLYIFGLVALDDLSRQFSNTRRTRKTWVGLILWPIVIPAAKVADLFDRLVP